MGKINAAIATTYLAAIFKDSLNAFLNVGIAGHLNLKVGQMVFAHKITDAIAGRAYFPSVLFDLKMPTKELLTVEKPRKAYVEDAVFDMEGFGFFEAASRFTYLDLIHSLKVISDNADHSFEKISKKVIENLIFQNIDDIENFINDLLML